MDFKQYAHLYIEDYVLPPNDRLIKFSIRNNFNLKQQFLFINNIKDLAVEIEDRDCTIQQHDFSDSIHHSPTTIIDTNVVTEFQVSSSNSIQPRQVLYRPNQTSSSTLRTNFSPEISVELNGQSELEDNNRNPISHLYVGDMSNIASRNATFTHYLVLDNMKYRNFIYPPFSIMSRFQPDEVAQAGFYFSLTETKLVCFSCGLDYNAWPKRSRLGYGNKNELITIHSEFIPTMPLH